MAASSAPIAPNNPDNMAMSRSGTMDASTCSAIVVTRTTGTAGSISRTVRRTVREMLPAVPVVRVTTMAEQVDASIVPERLIAMLSGLFGAMGALLAAIGLYGLLAYTVARRVNEIGIRMTLGATPGAV